MVADGNAAEKCHIMTMQEQRHTSCHSSLIPVASFVVQKPNRSCSPTRIAEIKKNSTYKSIWLWIACTLPWGLDGSQAVWCLMLKKGKYSTKIGKDSATAYTRIVHENNMWYLKRKMDPKEFMSDVQQASSNRHKYFNRFFFCCTCTHLYCKT